MAPHDGRGRRHGAGLEPHSGGGRTTGRACRSDPSWTAAVPGADGRPEGTRGGHARGDLPRADRRGRRRGRRVDTMNAYGRAVWAEALKLKRTLALWLAIGAPTAVVLLNVVVYSK